MSPKTKTESDRRWEEAFTTLCQAAGDDLNAFMGQPNAKPIVPPKAVQEAGRILFEETPRFQAEAKVRGLSEDAAIRYIIHAAKADALEAWWWKVGDKKLSKPAKRAEMRQWIENMKGGPLEEEEGD
jgi:hypothetical protein